MKQQEKTRRKIVKEFMSEPEIQALTKTSETTLYLTGITTLALTIAIPGYADIAQHLYHPMLATSLALVTASLTLNYTRRHVK